MANKNSMRLAMFTDIHWGARSNSEQHLQDCLNYIDWFCKIVKSENATHIAFLGDWMENRNAINVRTLAYSQEGARRLNALGLPIYFLIGNHDLYHRSNRAVFSTDHFKDLENFIVISEPLELNSELFATPFLFKDEYPTLVKDINAHKYVLGHFEFRDFVVTGVDRRLEHGPDAGAFSRPKYILSGHFHKRQANKNIVYIGNTFPSSFGDADDNERGCAILDTGTEELYFVNYENAPLFYKTRLTRILDGDCNFAEGSRVRCLLDFDIGYSEVQVLREEMMRDFKLREFSVEEDTQSIKSAVTNGKDAELEIDMTSLDNAIRQLILEGVSGTTTIIPEILVELYENLVE
jgi:DNA repair exonuclease SbcCD nuclease subunit